MPNLALKRREFLGASSAAAAWAMLCGREMSAAPSVAPSAQHPNLLFIFADQWRAQAAGYAGDPNLAGKTPNLDRLAGQSTNFSHAVSGCPVCTPYRGSLLTGKHWLNTGLFVNDVPLNPDFISIADAFKAGGYDTGYIGKWHVDGHGRSSYIPPERRQGFDFWQVLECTHDYNNSKFYAESDTQRVWDGYDAFAQTASTVQYLKTHEQDKPFAFFLSWGPPHDPYHTAPEKHRAMFPPENIVLRDNVPKEQEEKARQSIAGYCAHIAALDECLGQIMSALEDSGLAKNTILVFTSDHGDMLHSQGQTNKQRPWDESILVPLMMRMPEVWEAKSGEVDTLINTPDLMPTLLGLCNVAIPPTVEGRDFSADLRDGKASAIDAAIILCAHPFGQWTRAMGGREYRGVRTHQHTYVRSLDGPWLLFDNINDPYQLENHCTHGEYRGIQETLEEKLTALLHESGDEFLHGDAYIKKWGYTVDANGTVPYKG